MKAKFQIHYEVINKDTDEPLGVMIVESNKTGLGYSELKQECLNKGYKKGPEYFFKCISINEIEKEVVRWDMEEEVEKKFTYGQMQSHPDNLGNRVVGEDFITHIKGDIFAYDMKSAQYGILLVLNALEKEKKIILSETLKKRIKDAGIGV
jgi:hypothetical protein